MLVGVIKPMRFVRYCVAQLLGEIAASGIVLALTLGPLSVKSVRGYFLMRIVAADELLQHFSATKHQRSTRRIHRNVHLITIALVLAVLMLAVEKHQATPFAPVRLVYSCPRVRFAYAWHACQMTDRHRAYSVRVSSSQFYSSVPEDEEKIRLQPQTPAQTYYPHT